MPMKWDEQADAKLFALVLNVFNLKFTKEVIAQLNDGMGPECKGQAIQHRVDYIRKKAVGPTTSSPTKKDAASTKATTPKRGKGKKVSDDGDHEESKPKKRGRARTSVSEKSPVKNEPHSDTEEDELSDSPTKRIKEEPEKSFFDDED